MIKPLAWAVALSLGVLGLIYMVLFIIEMNMIKMEAMGATKDICSGILQTSLRLNLQSFFSCL